MFRLHYTDESQTTLLLGRLKRRGNPLCWPAKWLPKSQSFLPPRPEPSASLTPLKIIPHVHTDTACFPKPTYRDLTAVTSITIQATQLDAAHKARHVGLGFPIVVILRPATLLFFTCLRAAW